MPVPEDLLFWSTRGFNVISQCPSCTCLHHTLSTMFSHPMVSLSHWTNPEIQFKSCSWNQSCVGMEMYPKTLFDIYYGFLSTSHCCWWVLAARFVGEILMNHQCACFWFSFKCSNRYGGCNPCCCCIPGHTSCVRALELWLSAQKPAWQLRRPAVITDLG